MLRHPGIIAVEESYVLTPRLPDGIVTGSSATLVLLLDVNDPVHVGLQNFFQLWSVWRTVVDDHRFEICVRLGEGGIQTGGDHPGSFVARNDDADLRRRFGLISLHNFGRSRTAKKNRKNCQLPDCSSPGCHVKLLWRSNHPQLIPPRKTRSIRQVSTPGSLPA